MASVTLAEAQTMLKAWRDCELALANGQAKEYRIGTRMFTSVDLADIRASVRFWEDKVDVLSGQKNGHQTRVVVFRD